MQPVESEIVRARLKQFLLVSVLGDQSMWWRLKNLDSLSYRQRSVGVSLQVHSLRSDHSRLGRLSREPGVQLFTICLDEFKVEESCRHRQHVRTVKIQETPSVTISSSFWIP